MGSKFRGAQKAEYIQSVVGGDNNGSAFPELHCVYAIVKRKTTGPSHVTAPVYKNTNWEKVFIVAGGILNVQIHVNVEK